MQVYSEVSLIYFNGTSNQANVHKHAASVARQPSLAFTESANLYVVANHPRGHWINNFCSENYSESHFLPAPLSRGKETNILATTGLACPADRLLDSKPSLSILTWLLEKRQNIVKGKLLDTLEILMCSCPLLLITLWIMEWKEYSLMRFVAKLYTFCPSQGQNMIFCP